MKKSWKLIALLVGAFLFAPALPKQGASLSMWGVPQAKADFEAPPDPSPPPSPSPDPEPAKQNNPDNGKKKFRISKKTALKIVACTFGRGIFEVGKPLPLPNMSRMSRRQRARFAVEVKFYGRAKMVWGFGCGFAPNPGAGVVVGAGGIGLMDFHSRFISGERPIKRTARQEQLMFCRDGSSPCPSLAGVDPDMYGPR